MAKNPTVNELHSSADIEKGAEGTGGWLGSDNINTLSKFVTF
jgi:hypothetical protein